MSGPDPTLTPEYLAEDIGPSVIVTASVFIFFSTLFVVLRYYARYLTSAKFGAEDVIIPFAWAAEIGLCITGILMVKKAGAGRHLDFLLATDPGKVSTFFKGVLSNEILHSPAVAFPKLVVVILYLRVFTNKWARLVTWALVYIIGATWFSYTVASLVQCRPFAFNWDKTIPGGQCFNVTAFAISSSVPNIVTDVIVLFLPIQTIVDLKVSIGRRVGLMLIFLTGSAGIVASIIRTEVFISQSSNIATLNDLTFVQVELVNWTIIEPGMYLLAACAISFKPLFRAVAKALHLDSIITLTTSRKRTRTGGNTGTMPTVLHLDTMKSASHGGFQKLDSSRATEFDKTVLSKGHMRERSDFDIVVTTTVNLDVQRRWSKDIELEERPRFNNYPGGAV